jgi:hypothetical protein
MSHDVMRCNGDSLEQKDRSFRGFIALQPTAATLVGAPRPDQRQECRVTRFIHILGGVATEEQQRLSASTYEETLASYLASTYY